MKGNSKSIWKELLSQLEMKKANQFEGEKPNSKNITNNSRSITCQLISRKNNLTLVEQSNEGIFK